MALEFKIRFDCGKRELYATVKHLESGIVGEAHEGEDELTLQRKALIDLAHKMGRELEKRMLTL